jgi:hypothetical protein
VVRVVALLAVGVGLGFFAVAVAVALVLGMAAGDGFLFAVGVTVALVPGGLLPTVTLFLDASTGKASTPPAGNFTVLRHIDGWRQSRLGLMWRPNYFHGGYAIHGYSSVPNYPASHGCVRIPMPAMDRLWPRLTIGMPVHVYRRG